MTAITNTPPRRAQSQPGGMQGIVLMEPVIAKSARKLGVDQVHIRKINAPSGQAKIGPAELIYKTPLHPYSRALLSAVPRPDPEAAQNRRIRLVGDIPNAIHKPSGCAFRTRCPIAQRSCADEVPPLEFREGRWVACPWV